MNKRDRLIWMIVGLVIVLGGAFLIWRNSASVDRGNAKEMADLIVLDTPKPNAELQSPVEISGQARGQWYAESSFPLRLLDGNGQELVAKPVKATGDWMTQDFVPFATTLEFAQPTTATGTLMLLKDNPSGKPENDAFLRVPVKFALPEEATESETEKMAEVTSSGTDLPVQVVNKSPQSNPLASVLGSTMPVQVYFGDCREVTPVTRLVPRSVAVARAALTELLKGPSATEAKSGYQSSLPANVKINHLTIVDGFAIADFSPELTRGVGGTCRIQGIRAQIEATLRQFSTVHKVLILSGGEFTDVLVP